MDEDKNFQHAVSRSQVLEARIYQILIIGFTGFATISGFGLKDGKAPIILPFIISVFALSIVAIASSARRNLFACYAYMTEEHHNIYEQWATFVNAHELKRHWISKKGKQKGKQNRIGAFLEKAIHTIPLFGLMTSGTVIYMFFQNIELIQKPVFTRDWWYVSSLLLACIFSFGTMLFLIIRMYRDSVIYYRKLYVQFKKEYTRSSDNESQHTINSK